jgi:hypothetical protein
MPEILPHPVFSDPHIRMLRLCGRLQSDDAEILAAVAELGDMSHVFGRGEGDDAEYFALFGGSSESGDKKHVHLDIVRGSYFEKSQPPKLTSTEQAVTSLWARFFWQRVHVAVTGRFTASSREFTSDSMIARLSTPQNAGGVEIRQTGSKYEFSAGPLDGFDWSLSVKTEIVRTNIKMTIDDVIDEGYPKRMYDQAVGVFRGLLGDK